MFGKGDSPSEIIEEGMPWNLFFRAGIYFLKTERNDGGRSPIAFSVALLQRGLKEFLTANATKTSARSTPGPITEII